MALADALSLGLFECRKGRVRSANASFLRLMGVAQEAELLDLGLDDHVQDLGEGIPDWVAGELPPERCPVRVVPCGLRGLDGRQRQVVLRPLGDARWEVMDLGTLRGLDQELQQTQEGLREARAQLAQLGDRLDQEIHEREELLKVVSHELRTPITVIAGFTRLLLSEKAGAVNADQRHFLEEVRKSCDRLDRFVESLLVTGQEMAAGQPVTPRRASLETALAGVAAFLKPLVDERRQQLELHVAPGAAEAWFDPQRIEQVLINLIGNALKYSPEGGCIRVGAEPCASGARSFVEVAVQDQGPGVPEADRLRVFEPYTRGAAAPEGGLGLGLAICRRIVEAHDGVIGVSPAPGGGARFAFTLPLREVA